MNPLQTKCFKSLCQANLLMASGEICVERVGRLHESVASRDVLSIVRWHT